MREIGRRPCHTHDMKGQDMSKVKKQIGLKAPSRAAFESLLSGAYNIGPGVEPDTARGRNLTCGAMKAARTIYKLLDGAKPGTIQGVLLAVRLLAETACAEDPEGYAMHETWRGQTNKDRIEDRGATIKLPSGVKLPRSKKGQCYRCRFAHDPSDSGPTVCPNCGADFCYP